MGDIWIMKFKKTQMKKISLTIVGLIIFATIGFLWRQNYIQEKRIQVLMDSVEEKDRKIDELGKQSERDKNALIQAKRDYYEAISQNNTPQDILEESSPIDNIKSSMDQKCNEQQATYNSCLIKYNTEMIEWQSCQSGNKTFGCPLSSNPPLNTCGANISSWCRKQILGYY